MEAINQLSDQLHGNGAATKAPNGNSSTATLPSLATITQQSAFTDPTTSPITSRTTLHNAHLLPGQPKSLSGISLRSFLLGASLSTSLSLSLILSLHYNHTIWRIPLFLSLLSTFHFLEFYTTARYNTSYANISAFLLSRNGKAYFIAHTAAMVECGINSLFLPGWQARFAHPALLGLGFVMVILGQATRTTAMVQAGTNFNHTVQTRKAEGHTLVTTGIYQLLRHPSYFGFFWWGLGTQVVCGNPVCFLGYAIVLWGFFQGRIAKEEEFLCEFFGEEYVEYRKRTRVGIPFVP